MYNFIFNLLKTWIFKTSSGYYKSPELDTDPAKKVGIAEQIVLYADPIGIGGHRYLKI
jgi:hypothetical protein